ncbi:MAG TPA: class II aldolase/adducin family protein [Candidatus Limnocylindrales bacterium]|nr:class II aldolase/adducin family protein [Candidatus Limnocylindrales bacterium]
MTGNVAAVREEIVRVARLLRERGLAVGTSGNVGARLDDGRIAITPSTMDYDEMTADDVVIVGPDGSASEGHRRPSSELPLHVAVFAARPAVRAIVHTHSPFATTFSAARREIPAVHYVLALLVAPGRDTIRVAPYATFGTEALGRNVAATLGEDNAVLIANHGAIAVGQTLASAFGRAERVEELAMLAWRAQQIGGATLLDADELDRVRAQMGRFPRQIGGG